MDVVRLYAVTLNYLILNAFTYTTLLLNLLSI